MFVAILTGIIFVSLVSLLIHTLVAYSRRKDRRFWGGIDILNGWWVFFPYGKNGMKEGNDNIVWGARISWFILIATGTLLFVLKNSIS